MSDSLIFIVAMLAGCLALYAWAAVVLHSIGASNSRILVRLADMVRSVFWGLPTSEEVEVGSSLCTSRVAQALMEQGPNR